MLPLLIFNLGSFTSSCKYSQLNHCHHLIHHNHRYFISIFLFCFLVIIIKAISELFSYSDDFLKICSHDYHHRSQEADTVDGLTWFRDSSPDEVWKLNIFSISSISMHACVVSYESCSGASLEGEVGRYWMSQLTTQYPWEVHGMETLKTTL